MTRKIPGRERAKKADPARKRAGKASAKKGIAKKSLKKVLKKAPKKAPAKKAPPGRKSGAGGRTKTQAAPSSFRGLGLKEAAAAVFNRLSAAGHDPILAGQACSSIYGGGNIKARTIEFAIREFAVVPVNRLMAELGFKPREARTFANNSCLFEVVLLAAPLTVGDDPISGARMIKTSQGPLRLLTPTDCVRQRLSMFYRWGDRSALAEAVQVAKRQAVDMEIVGRWSEWEWATDRFQEFLQALKEARS